MRKRRQPVPERPLVVWLLGFHVARLVLAFLVWTSAPVLGLVVFSWLGGNSNDALPFAGGYGVGSLLSVALWLWYRGWWHLGDQTLQALLRLTPRQFEEAVAMLLPTLGYRDVKVTGGPGDLGADVLCQDAEGRRVAVQCKHYAPGNNVDSPDIQLFLGAMRIHEAERGIVATTAAFTQPARVLAKEQGVQLLAGTELSRLFQATQILPKAKAK